MGMHAAAQRWVGADEAGGSDGASQLNPVLCEQPCVVTDSDDPYLRTDGERLPVSEARK